MEHCGIVTVLVINKIEKFHLPFIIIEYTLSVVLVDRVL